MSSTPSTLNAELAALSSLPAATLAKLIDPAAAPAPIPSPAAEQARAFDPSTASANPDAGVALAGAYVREMKTQAAALAPGVIGRGEDHEGRQIEAIRASAEEVKAAVEGYSAATGIKAAQ